MARRLRFHQTPTPALLATALAEAGPPAEIRFAGVAPEDTVALLRGAGYRPAYELVTVERALETPLPSLPASSPPLLLWPLEEDPFPWFALALTATANRQAAAPDPRGAWRRLRALGDVGDAGLARLGGEPVGLLVPRWRSAETASFAFVGVLPWQRGRGLGRRLHALGLEWLRASGFARYRDQTDVDNLAMRAVFARNGCRELETTTTWTQIGG